MRGGRRGKWREMERVTEGRRMREEERVGKRDTKTNRGIKASSGSERNRKQEGRGSLR